MAKAAARWPAATSTGTLLLFKLLAEETWLGLKAAEELSAACVICDRCAPKPLPTAFAPPVFAGRLNAAASIDAINELLGDCED